MSREGLKPGKAFRPSGLSSNGGRALINPGSELQKSIILQAFKEIFFNMFF